MRMVSRLSGTLSLFREMHFKKVTCVHPGWGVGGESGDPESKRKEFRSKN